MRNSWTNSAPLNFGRIAINLKPFSERHSNAEQIMARLKKKVAGLPGIELHLRTCQELTVGGRSSATQFQYTLEDTQLYELYDWAPKLVEHLKKLPELSDVNSDMGKAAPRTKVVIDRDHAAQFGITPQAVDGLTPSLSSLVNDSDSNSVRTGLLKLQCIHPIKTLIESSVAISYMPYA